MGSTSIKDTVHGYIDLDELEQRVVDSPWFQRLRRVRQNDVGSFVFPTMLTTRFEHSLGAMHLAGKCLSAALADETTRTSVELFLAALRTEVSAFNLQIADDRMEKFALRCVRMYGALHDIGHPPYSHLIESCYSAHAIGVKADPRDHWHEVNGATIIRTLLTQHLNPQDEDAAVLNTVAHLATKNVNTPALEAMKRLVDSVIDADRMDFILRDGRNSGAEFGAYDVQRLTSSFRAHVEEVRPGNVQTVLIRPLHKALSAIESLIQERYKIYRWVLFHHRVMQSRALMRYVIEHSSHDPSFDPHQFQPDNYIPKLASPPTALKLPYVLLGDGVVDQYLDRRLRDLEADRAIRTLTPEERRIRTALRILIFREDRGTSLWKRTDVYSNERDPSSFESQLRSAFASGSPSPQHQRLQKAHGSYANWVADVLARPANKDIQTKILEQLNTHNDPTSWFLLEVPSFKAGGEDRMLVPADGGGLKPEHLSDVSTVARAIDEARKGDVHMFAFRFSDEETSDTDRAKREGRAALANVIAALYRSRVTVREQFEPDKV